MYLLLFDRLIIKLIKISYYYYIKINIDYNIFLFLFIRNFFLYTNLIFLHVLLYKIVHFKLIICLLDNFISFHLI